MRLIGLEKDLDVLVGLGMARERVANRASEDSIDEQIEAAKQRVRDRVKKLRLTLRHVKAIAL